jgi:hypothetical protein
MAVRWCAKVAAVAAEAVAKAPIRRIHLTSREHRARRGDARDGRETK